eukprot:747062-Hanusia_phi.AAC.1
METIKTRQCTAFIDEGAIWEETWVQSTPDKQTSLIKMRRQKCSSVYSKIPNLCRSLAIWDWHDIGSEPRLFLEPVKP